MALPVKGNPETILLVEDHLVLLKLVKQILEDAGYAVMAASSAKQAMLLDEEHPATIDLLLSDVRMRGMSGADLANKLKERRPHMHVVLMSGYPGGASLALNYGWHYLQKPFKPTSLVHVIDSILRGNHKLRAPAA